MRFYHERAFLINGGLQEILAMVAGIVKQARPGSFSSYCAMLLAFLVAGASVPAPEQKPVQLKAAERARFPLAGHVYALAFSADGNALACVTLPASGGWPGEVRLWDSAAGRGGTGTLPDTKGMFGIHAGRQDVGHRRIRFRGPQ